MSNRLTVTPREAAALDRLLDAYVGNDDADPGMDDLRTLRTKIEQLDQDHTAYGVFTLREPRAEPVSTDQDPWRMAEWNALPDRCLISACEGDEIDQHGPVLLADGSMHKACTEHWAGVFRVLGEQVTWERTDGARTTTAPNPSGGEVR